MYLYKDIFSITSVSKEKKLYDGRDIFQNTLSLQ